MRWIWKQKVRLGWLAFASLVLALLALAGTRMLLESNFRKVEKFQVYRAGQLNDHEWAESLKRKNFKTFLNLRGENEGNAWYDHEKNMVEQHGIAHIDFALKAAKQPPLEKMEQLVAIMRVAAKPMLIHCKSGADRTGLASALYVYAVMGKSADEARQQLSIRYGHFPWLYSDTWAMDRALEEYIAAYPH